MTAVRIAARRPDLEPYPASAGSLTEAVLVRGYALTDQAPRTARCACGGTIDATDGPISAAIRDHQGTPEHRAWRAALPTEVDPDVEALRIAREPRRRCPCAGLEEQP